MSKVQKLDKLLESLNLPHLPRRETYQDSSQLVQRDSEVTWALDPKLAQRSRVVDEILQAHHGQQKPEKQQVESPRKWKRVALVLLILILVAVPSLLLALLTM